MLSKLLPYMSPATTTVGQAASPLAGGAPAAALAGGTTHPNMNAAAQANVQQGAKRSFADLATKCEQVKLSLTNHGAGDSRDLWYLGFLSLAHHCADGATYAHELSKGDPRYVPADVDAAMAQVAREKARKDTGPPRCTAFDGHRPGVCQGCPHFGKIISPWMLGVPDTNGDLPAKYRRNNGMLEKWVENANGGQFVAVVAGDVYGPIVDKGSDGYAIGFTYELAGSKFPIRVSNEQIIADASSVGANMARQCITIEVPKIPLFREFVVSWISTIREQKGERTEHIPPFGFAATEAGAHIGVSIGGTLYRSDGTTEAAPGPSQYITDAFTPRGEYAKWREAFDLVCKGSIHRQILVAAAFGSPLMHFTGQKGLMISAWGPSGVGKSAALQVGQTVYSKPSMMSTLKSTDNAANHKAHTTQFLPSYWDEMRIDKDDAVKLINRIFDMAQGQGAQRLTPTIQLREPETWQTLAIVASNNRLMDFVVDKVKGNDAGAVRLFEFDVNIPKLKGTAAAAPIIQNTKLHYGHAGRMYLSWIATHYAETEKLVADLTEQLVQDLQQEGEERLYIAGIAAILAGAIIATKQGIAKFDVKAMGEFFKFWFLQLRHDRNMNLVTVGGKTDVEEVLAQFMGDHLNSRLITDKMMGLVPGRPGGVSVVWPPQTGKVEAHISEQDQLLRINHHSFAAWCRRRNLNALDVEEQLKQQFAVKVGKMSMGAGTPFSNGRLKVIEVSLTHPSLAGYATNTQQAAAHALAKGAKP